MIDHNHYPPDHIVKMTDTFSHFRIFAVFCFPIKDDIKTHVFEYGQKCKIAFFRDTSADINNLTSSIIVRVHILSFIFACAHA